MSHSDQQELLEAIKRTLAANMAVGCEAGHSLAGPTLGTLLPRPEAPEAAGRQQTGDDFTHTTNMIAARIARPASQSVRCFSVCRPVA